MKLLVLTALEETWGTNQEILFLGEWCKIYTRRQFWELRVHETVVFHWDDREKLKKDYQYLEFLHQSILKSLTVSLNDFHEVDFSMRYWQILLDPWLMSYIGILFDRWECLRIANEKNANLECIFLDRLNTTEVAFSWTELMQLALSDEWNQSIYQRILKSEYAYRYKEIKKNDTENFNKYDNYHFDNSPSRSKIYRIISTTQSTIDHFFGKFIKEYKVVFIESFFNLKALIRVNLALRQFPRLFLNDFKMDFEPRKLTSSNFAIRDRNKMRINMTPKTNFESFIKECIIADLPVSLIEQYSNLSNSARSVQIKTKVIVTANKHWGDLYAKFWIAYQVNQGVKLIILEHGGSIPAFKELFNFEEDIADIKGTWFIPYHPKHFQVPPSKLVNSKTSNLVSRHQQNVGFCSLIGNEYPRWVYRVHFYPMAHQCLKSFEDGLEFYSNLDQQIKDVFRVKPYPVELGWNTKDRYCDILGKEKVLSEKKLKFVIQKSRVIVCTYPETTFSEAMASGVPTILMYPSELYERNQVAFPILETLVSVKILFHNPKTAADHVNSIWNDPSIWWNSDDVYLTRLEFQRQAQNIDDKWLDTWISFLNKMIE